jgi:hypothetical protein
MSMLKCVLHVREEFTSGVRTGASIEGRIDGLSYFEARALTIARKRHRLELEEGPTISVIVVGADGAFVGRPMEPPSRG